MITMNQTHSKTFHCTYLLHYYPFDTQVIHLKSEGPHSHLPLFKCVDLISSPEVRHEEEEGGRRGRRRQ